MISQAKSQHENTKFTMKQKYELFLKTHWKKSNLDEKKGKLWQIALFNHLKGNAVGIPSFFSEKNFNWIIPGL